MCPDPQKLDQRTNEWRSGYYHGKIQLRIQAKGSAGVFGWERRIRRYSKAKQHTGRETGACVGESIRRIRRGRADALKKKQELLFPIQAFCGRIVYDKRSLISGIGSVAGNKHPSLIARWVNDFRIAGPDALRPKKKGRKKTLDNKKFKKPSKTAEVTPVDTSAEHVKELEDENLKLRIENAYLKELRRLCLEEEALLKKNRESFTVSENSSN